MSGTFGNGKKKHSAFLGIQILILICLWHFYWQFFDLKQYITSAITQNVVQGSCVYVVYSLKSLCNPNLTNIKMLKSLWSESYSLMSTIIYEIYKILHWPVQNLDRYLILFGAFSSRMSHLVLWP